MISNQAVRVAVPATNGAHENVTATGVPSEPCAATLSLNGTNRGSGDHGPVHATTTATRIPIGTNPAWIASMSSWRRSPDGRSAGLPPTGSGAGVHTRRNSSSDARQVSAPITAGR